jgi:periplasmic divalent cation tolerance protein
MSEIVSVYAVFANDEEARSIGNMMVQERLAACVNLLGSCHSIYRWHGRVEEAEEAAAIFKTTAGQAPFLIARIAKLHSYDLPAAVSWPIVDASETYRQWVVENSGR